MLQRWMQVIVVVCISLGLFLFTFKSTHFNVTGFAMCLTASIVSGLRWSLTQLVAQRAELGQSEVAGGQGCLFALPFTLLSYCRPFQSRGVYVSHPALDDHRPVSYGDSQRRYWGNSHTIPDLSLPQC